MMGMFYDAVRFNGDLSSWDVSSVTNMDFMFKVATSFKRTLSGAAWVHSEASKKDMFAGSYGSISSTVCALRSRRRLPVSRRKPKGTASTPVFSPQSKDELKSAVDAC